MQHLTTTPDSGMTPLDEPQLPSVEVPSPNPLGVAMLLALACGGVYGLIACLW